MARRSTAAASPRGQRHAAADSPERSTGQPDAGSPDLAEPAFSVQKFPFYLMHFIIAKNNRNIGNAIAKYGITPAVWRLLALLQERDGIMVSELSEHSMIERTLLSRVLQTIEKRGLVRRDTDPTDKRRTVIYLEPKGRTLFQELLPSAIRQIRWAVDGLSDDERGQLQMLLQRIAANVSRSPFA